MNYTWISAFILFIYLYIYMIWFDLNFPGVSLQNEWTLLCSVGYGYLVGLDSQKSIYVE